MTNTDDRFISVSPALEEIVTGTPAIMVGDICVVAGIGGDFIPCSAPIATTGSVTLEKDTVTITEGYVQSGTLTVPAGKISLMHGDNRITIGEGYHEETTLRVGATLPGYTITPGTEDQTIPVGRFIIGQPITVLGDVNLVSENIKKDVSIFGVVGSLATVELVKVTDYTPAREELTEPTQVIVSGIGMIGGDEYGTDGSAANGTYIVTDETKYKSGLARIYKQVDGDYYLAGYDSSAEEYAEYSTHWYLSTSPTGYGWNSLVYFDGNTIPSGTNSWQNMDYGSASVTTEITTETLPALTETISAYSVSGFDEDTGTGVPGGTASVSGYAITPQVNGIYCVQEGKLIGQHINRELTIPTDGLVRRFKAVNGHFVDTVWGTEMLPSGDISYAEMGYAGNNAAPFAKTTGSYLNAGSTLSSPPTVGTVNLFFRFFSSSGTSGVFSVGDDGEASRGFFIIRFNGEKIIVKAFNDNQSIVSGCSLEPVVWHMVTLTFSYAHGIDSKDGTDRVSEHHYSLYVDGKLQGTADRVFSETEYGTSFGDIQGNTVRAFANMNNTSESIIGQVDEACIWNRILSDSEIAEMAKGLQSFNWDIPEKEYIQEQPVFYAPLTDTSATCPTGQIIRVGHSGGIPASTYFRDGAFWNYYTNSDGGITYDLFYSERNYSALYTSGSYTVCVDVYFEGKTNNNYSSSVYNQLPVISSGHDLNGVYVWHDYDDTNMKAGFKGVAGTAVFPNNTWTTIIARSTNGVLELFTAGVLNGSGAVTDPYPFSTYDNVRGPYSYFKGAIRNIRLYNRAITDEEIQELSGIVSGTETE